MPRILPHAGTTSFPQRLSLAIAAVATLAAAPTQLRAEHRCLSLNHMSVMFDNTITHADLHAVKSAQPITPQFVVGGLPWNYTALNGPRSQGQALALTYSFVTAPIQINDLDQTAPTAPNNLVDVINTNFPGGMDAFKQAVREAFLQWSLLVNISYFEVPDDGAPFGLQSPGLKAVPGVVGRGDIRIAMRTLPDTIMAYNHYPQAGGDMVLNAAKIGTFAVADVDGLQRILRNTILHEHGHGLGLNHVESSTRAFLMEPGVDPGLITPQEDDVRGAQHLYGDIFEPNETLEATRSLGVTLRPVEQVGEQLYEISNLALERFDSNDYLSFNVEGTTSLGLPPAVNIRVEPIGTIYPAGPEGGTQVNVNALAARNLDIELYWWDGNSYQLVYQFNTKGAGEAEAIKGQVFSAGGTYVLRVFSTDNVNDVQQYKIWIGNVLIPDGFPQIAVSKDLTAIEDGGAYTDLIEATKVGQSRGINLLIRNLGDADLLFTGTPDRVEISGPHAADYTATVNTDSLAPNPNLFGFLTITLTPSAAGDRTATFTIPCNDRFHEDFTFTLTTQALDAPIARLLVNGEELAHNADFGFGAVTLGETASVDVEIQNIGTANLNLTGATLTGVQRNDFAITLTPGVIAPGGSTTGTLSATPSVAGPRTAFLNIQNDSAQNPFSLILRATGIAEAAISDCDGNGVDDADDLAAGASDCDANNLLDACEANVDGDGVIDACDNCVDVANPGQEDADGNGAGDACELPVEVPPVEEDEPVEEEAVDPDADGDDADADQPVADKPVDENAAADTPESDLDVDEEVLEDDAADDEDGQQIVPPMPMVGCGAGAAGLIPMMFLGLMGIRRKAGGL